jgi:hypothetical protein
MTKVLDGSATYGQVVSPANVEVVEFVSADGLSAQFDVLRGAHGRMMPPIELWDEIVPLQSGSRFIGARHGTRPLVFPVFLDGPVSGRLELRSLARVLDPLRGLGTLRILNGAYSGRQITCVYESGLDQLSEELPDWVMPTLAFRAFDPYWTDASEQSQIITPGSNVSAAGFNTWTTWYPLIFSSTTIFADLSITNASDAVVWPIITVTGPGTDLQLTNVTTSQSLVLPGSIADGSRVVFDSRPGYKTVTRDGVNIFSQLTATSAFWPLLPGTNRITITFSSTTPARTQVVITFRPRYLAA